MIENAKKTFEAGGAVSAKRLVKLSGGQVVHNTATATDDPIGVAEFAAAAQGDPVAVRLINGAGTFEMTAAGAIDADADVYAAADGKIQALPVDAADYRKVGKALEAATADGDIIEVLSYDINHVETVS